jgi:meso-butanediol dehydrogenase / (S,S)-butanediol dehydrogenase / diacetyl reductase
MAGRLEGKVALVAGASKGIGRATAVRMAEEGATVVVAARSMDLLEALVQEIEGKGGKAEAARLDIGDLDAYRTLIRDTAEKYGHLDIFVHNAMAGSGAPFMQLTHEIWNDNMKLNAEACFAATQEAAKAMIAQGKGSIINIASIGGIKVPLGHCAYGASKAAMLHMTRCAAAELAPLNVRVNTVSPGQIETEVMFGALDKWASDVGGDVEVITNTMRDMIPMKRFGLDTELANAVVFLASDEASFITGENIMVDGGRCGKM